MGKNIRGYFAQGQGGKVGYRRWVRLAAKRLLLVSANAYLGIALMVWRVYAREESRYFMAVIIV